MLSALALALLAACDPFEPPRKPWHDELTVIVPQNSNSVDAKFERQLVTLFADQLHAKIRLLPLPQDEVIAVLTKNKAHLAAAGLRSNEANGIRFGMPYHTVREQVVCGGAQPHGKEQLAARKIAVVAGSAQEAALSEAQQTLPGLIRDARRSQTVADLLAEVATNKLDCTVANEEQVAMARNFHPGLTPLFEIAPPSKLAWAFAPDGDNALLEEANRFLGRIERDGTLRRLIDTHYGHNERLDPVDSVSFITKTRTDLPHFLRLFQEAEDLTGIEWELLAALAYQESHWDPLATSPTNVRGIMMLTAETADRMNVSNRLDPRQSII